MWSVPLLMLLVTVAVAAPFAVVACGVWGLTPLFEREREDSVNALPVAQVAAARWRWGGLLRHRPLTWSERARVTVGALAAVLTTALVQALLTC